VGGVEVESPFFREITHSLRSRTDRQTALGVDLGSPRVCEADGWVLYQMAYFPFEVDKQGRPHARWDRPRRHFSTFDQYHRFLLDRAEALLENAADGRRAASLQPVTTVSSGYDSVAVSAVLSELGCTEALTLDVSVEGASDSGVVPGEALGLHVSRFAHPLGDTLDSPKVIVGPGLVESAAEFIATSGIGDDIILLPFEPMLRSRVLFTGKYGDSLWSLDAPMRHGLPVPIKYGKSYSEFRLRVGFAHVPLPALGARFSAPLRRLSIETSMMPFRTGGAYERPVARRLAEQAGVPRGSFGQMKRATSPSPQNRADLFPEAVQHVSLRYREWRRVTGERSEDMIMI
jgi:hypothetical protein